MLIIAEKLLKIVDNKIKFLYYVYKLIITLMGNSNYTWSIREKVVGGRPSAPCIMNPPKSIWEQQPKGQNPYINEML